MLTRSFIIDCRMISGWKGLYLLMVAYMINTNLLFFQIIVDNMSREACAIAESVR